MIEVKIVPKNNDIIEVSDANQLEEGIYLAFHRYNVGYGESVLVITESSKRTGKFTSFSVGGSALVDLPLNMFNIIAKMEPNDWWRLHK